MAKNLTESVRDQLIPWMTRRVIPNEIMFSLRLCQCHLLININVHLKSPGIKFTIFIYIIIAHKHYIYNSILATAKPAASLL